MKIVLLFLGIFFASYSVGFSQEGYKIEGNIPGLPDGGIVLVVPTVKGIVTLGKTEVKNGIFVFEGQVEQGCVALIKTADGKETIPVMLENTGIKMRLSEAGLVIEGGEAQQLYNQYLALTQDIARGQSQIQTQFELAMKMRSQVQMDAVQKQSDTYAREARQREIEWLETNGNHYVAAYILASLMDQLDYEDLKARFNLLGFNGKSSFYGQLFAARVMQQRSVAVGELAPDFTVPTSRGDTIRLHELKGKVKLLCFWESSNSICRQWNVELLKLYNKYRLKGLEILSVSLDESAQAWKAAITEDGMTWKNASELKGPVNSDIVRQYFVKNIPHSLLLDAENRIVAKDLNADELKKKIAEMLKKSKEK